MKVQAEIRLTILDGVEVGNIIEKTYVADTTQRVTEYGIIEELDFRWSYLISPNRANWTNKEYYAPLEEDVKKVIICDQHTNEGKEQTE